MSEGGGNLALIYSDSMDDGFWSCSLDVAWKFIPSPGAWAYWGIEEINGKGEVIGYFLSTGITDRIVELVEQQSLEWA
jgi:hypothetical protein